jgi:hypothetical protein
LIALDWANVATPAAQATPPTAVAGASSAAHTGPVTMVAGQSKGLPVRHARPRDSAVSTTGAAGV